MNEGYWIDSRTGRSIEIDEHEIDIRRPEVARRLGVPHEVLRQFGRFVPGTDRVQFLKWLMRHAPIIRARGYGVVVSVQWGCVENDAALRAIHKWGRKVGCGPCLMLCMSNIKTGERMNSFWLRFDEAMRKGKAVESMPVEVRTE